MALIVQKYGGSSVADPGKIVAVADKIGARRAAGDRLAVVISAMGKTTDQLLELVRGVAEPEPGPEMDLLLATGEMVSASLLAMALNSRGVPARAFTGREAGIITDGVHTRARISRLRPRHVREALEQGVVAIVTGFQGVSAEDRVTTLGRGGSDLSAVALARGLRADRCEIYTDVPGIFTADPRLVPESRVIPVICYEEALELASAGAAVMQSRAVEFGQKYGVVIHVRSTFSDDGGTMITRVRQGRRRKSLEEPLVSAVTGTDREAKISIFEVPDRPGTAAGVFNAIAAANINVDVIVQNVSRDGKTDLSFTIPRADLERTERIAARATVEAAAGGYAADEDVAKVSVVGIGMQSHPGVAAKMFAALGEAGINIEMISTSEIKISCVIRKKDFAAAVRTLHRAFGLEAPADSA